MSKLGGWKINFKVGSYPQKIASKLSEGIKLCGCTYKDVAYLGSQEVVGTNHAILAEQTVTNGEDTKNVVILIFNEKQDSMDVSLVDIHRIVESGGKLGGTQINLTTEIPEDAQEVFDNRVTRLGATVTPVAFIGTKVTSGTDYKFLAVIDPAIRDSELELAIVTINPMRKSMDLENVLE